MKESYIFSSERLGFRNWKKADVVPMAIINSNPAVMEFFPGTITKIQTEPFIERMQTLLSEKGFCYFAVDRLDTQQFIGFIGISEQTFPAEFTPCIDIGWRLSSDQWNGLIVR